MEEIYNKWKLQDKDLGNTERYQFTKSELLDFAKYYYKQQLILNDVVGRSKQLKPLPPNECETCGVLIDPRLTSCGSCGF